MGLLALMLLQESRRAARTSPEGDLILLEDQDRSLWNREQIAEGEALVERALASRRFGVYTIQAAIAAVHAEAPTVAATDWAQIVALYDVLARAQPSPVVELNRAVAVAMRDGPAAGLQQIDAILARGDLADHHLAHAARPISAGGWEGRPKPENPTGGHSCLRGRNRSVVSSIVAFANWAEKISDPRCRFAASPDDYSVDRRHDFTPNLVAGSDRDRIPRRPDAERRKIRCTQNRNESTAGWTGSSESGPARWIAAWGRISRR